MSNFSVGDKNERERGFIIEEKWFIRAALLERREEKQLLALPLMVTALYCSLAEHRNIHITTSSLYSLGKNNVFLCSYIHFHQTGETTTLQLIQLGYFLFLYHFNLSKPQWKIQTNNEVTDCVWSWMHHHFLHCCPKNASHLLSAWTHTHSKSVSHNTTHTLPLV